MRLQPGNVIVVVVTERGHVRQSDVVIEPNTVHVGREGVAIQTNGGIGTMHKCHGFPLLLLANTPPPRGIPYLWLRANATVNVTDVNVPALMIALTYRSTVPVTVDRSCVAPVTEVNAIRSVQIALSGES